MKKKRQKHKKTQPNKQTKRDKNTGTDQDMQRTRRNRQYKRVKLIGHASNSVIQFLDLRVK
jgi:hypothetical protein